MSNMLMSDEFSEEEIDEIIAKAASMGLKASRSDAAVRLAWTVMNRPMCTTRFDLSTLDRNPTEGTTCYAPVSEVDASVCGNGCCVNFTAIPRHIMIAGSLMEAMHEGRGDDLVRKFGYILTVTGMD